MRSRSKPTNAKREELRKQGCLHPHPDTVTHELFVQQEFFDCPASTILPSRIDSLILQPSGTRCLIRCVTKIWEVTDGSGYQ